MSFPFHAYDFAKRCASNGQGNITNDMASNQKNFLNIVLQVDSMAFFKMNAP